MIRAALILALFFGRRVWTAALAAISLIDAVSLHAAYGHPIVDSVAIFSTENGGVRVAKNVPILEVSPHVQTKLSGAGFFPGGAVSFIETFDLIAGPSLGSRNYYFGLLRWSGFGRRNIGVCWNVVQNSAPNSAYGDICRCSSVVDKPNPKLRNEAVDIVERNCIDKNIGSLDIGNYLSGFLSGLGGGARRARQADCEASEYRGENCNDESRKSGDFISVTMNEVAEWNEQRAYHGGAVFVGGMIFFVMFAGLYLWMTW
jgi:hypothetical protein